MAWQVFSLSKGGDVVSATTNVTAWLSILCWMFIWHFWTNRNFSAIVSCQFYFGLVELRFCGQSEKHRWEQDISLVASVKFTYICMMVPFDHYCSCGSSTFSESPACWHVAVGGRESLWACCFVASDTCPNFIACASIRYSILKSRTLNLMLAEPMTILSLIRESLRVWNSQWSFVFLSLVTNESNNWTSCWW